MALYNNMGEPRKVHPYYAPTSILLQKKMQPFLTAFYQILLSISMYLHRIQQVQREQLQHQLQ